MAAVGEGGPAVGYSVADLIRKGGIAAGSPDREALSFEGRRVTFGELDARSDRLAAGLRERGFGKGERAAILSYNSVEFFEVYFAIAKLGGVVVPVNYLLRPAEVDYALRDSGSTWLFADAHGLEVATPILDGHPELHTVALEPGADRGIAYADLLASSASPPDPVEVAPDDLFLLQYTSGTTGYPKGAMHTHATVIFNALHQIADFRLTAEDVYMIQPALCWAAGINNVVLALWSIGGRVVLRPSGGFDADELCAALAAERATMMIGVASVLRLLVGSGVLGQHDLGSLRLIAVGGEAVAPSLLEAAREQLPQTDIGQVYGQTEFPTLMAFLGAERALEKPASTGQATSMCKLKVVDESGEEVAPGEHGEIICRSPATMKGYWMKPEQTAETIVDGWLRTGDRGYYDEEGFLYIAGRSKEMYISGGLNVYPAEAEVVLAEHPEVAEVAIKGVADERFGEVGCAFLVAVGDDLDLAAVEAFCRERLATYKVPRHWVVLSEPLPRTASGKAEKHRLEPPVEA
ncbi:MAG TPA: AMP-binding protein [Solirubrobacterales bacterium]|nr:AMP-binding protein [Solirubrobacterales bacterium]